MISNLKYNSVLSILLIAILTIGCSKQLSFDELITYKPSKFKTKLHLSERMQYSISLLDCLALVEKEYSDTTGYELFVDTSISFEKGTSILSIMKFNSTATTLEEAWNKLMTNRVRIKDFQIFSQGLTNYLSKPSYYEHSTCTMNNSKTESISFLFKSDSSFYLLSIQANREKGYPDNLKELLFSTKSIKILP